MTMTQALPWILAMTSDQNFAIGVVGALLAMGAIVIGMGRYGNPRMKQLENDRKASEKCAEVFGKRLVEAASARDAAEKEVAYWKAEFNEMAEWNREVDRIAAEILGDTKVSVDTTKNANRMADEIRTLRRRLKDLTQPAADRAAMGDALPITVAQARKLKCCRICRGPDSPRQDDAFVLSFGDEYAHRSCINKIAEQVEKLKPTRCGTED